MKQVLNVPYNAEFISPVISTVWSRWPVSELTTSPTSTPFFFFAPLSASRGDWGIRPSVMSQRSQINFSQVSDHTAPLSSHSFCPCPSERNVHQKQPVYEPVCNEHYWFYTADKSRAVVHNCWRLMREREREKKKKTAQQLHRFHWSPVAAVWASSVATETCSFSP